ncbi:hypothetical protein ACFPM1_12540 [Halorubrum rubrum]|uniref:HEAT repeat domain-containing protein n=1 Tax=Halorubrum rubrum TaxID=1126240 RepID=A0ABD5R3V2_9EURY|nr:hypothetical protein [Halorubrum rubrum]
MPDFDRIAELADGFPSFAVMIARNAAKSEEPLDNLLEIGDETLINKLIGSENMGEQELKKHRRVLEVFALFDKVEWKLENEERSEEARWLAEVAGFEEHEEEIEFNEIVDYQRERGILTGEYYLSVSPLPLATHLLGSWLRKHGKTEIEELFEQMPPQMFSRFGERIPYMAAYRPGRQWIAERLSQDGMFYENDGDLLTTDWGSHLFKQFAEAAPREAIKPLEHFIEQKSVNELLEFTTGRRNIVRSIQYMVVWDDTFKRAAKILLNLAEAENEEYANNASGIFTNLFSPGWGKLAPTETAPQERLTVLEEAIRSDSEKRQLLAVKAAGVGLQNPNRITKTVGPEYQGARESPDLWQPETYGDLFDYYRSVWEFLQEELDEMPEQVRGEAVEVMLDAVRGLAKLHPSLSQMIRSSLEEFSEYDWVDNGRVIRTSVDLVHYDSDELEDIEEAEEWRSFVVDISEDSFETQLERYVGLNLLADDDVYEEKLGELAAKAIEGPQKLESQLDWLATSVPNQYRAREFGYEVGTRDENNSFLSDILAEIDQAQDDDRSISFLSGYLSALHERDEAARQEVFDDIQQNDRLRPYLVDLIRLSAVTPRDAERIVELIQEGEVSASSLRGLEMGGVSRNFEEQTFREIVELLLEIGADEAATILPTFFHYYVYPDEAPELPEELTLELLTHPAFVEPEQDIVVRQGISHDWKEIAHEYIQQHPDHIDDVLETILDILGDRGSIIGGSPEIKELLYDILRDQPERTWNKITTVLDERDERLVPLFHWFRGDAPRIDDKPIEYVPPTHIWEWIEDNEEVNAILAARIVPAEFFHSNERICLAQELLKRYGDREDVRNELSANYHTGSWMGPESKHYQQKKDQLELFKEDESNENVLRWINDEIDALEEQIEQAKKNEERLGFDSD